jgi:hypothetical protein
MQLLAAGVRTGLTDHSAPARFGFFYNDAVVIFLLDK